MTKLTDRKASLLKNPEVHKEYEALDEQFALTKEQLAEIRRRRADPNRKLVSHDEARARIKRLGA